MPSKNKKQHSVKLVSPLSNLSVIRKWLVENCGRRWNATNYKNQPLAWRALGRISSDSTGDLYAHMDYTVIVNFNKREDMMLFLLVWPGEVLIN